MEWHQLKWNSANFSCDDWRKKKDNFSFGNGFKHNDWCLLIRGWDDFARASKIIFQFLEPFNLSFETHTCNFHLSVCPPLWSRFYITQESLFGSFCLAICNNRHYNNNDNIQKKYQLANLHRTKSKKKNITKFASNVMDRTIMKWKSESV